jgi:hypothetical protein
MNQNINMNYRFKYIAVGIVIYIVSIYAWKYYKKD